MSGAGLLFVTAPAADTKTINRALLHLRNWDFGEESYDSFHIVSTKDIDSFKTSLSSGNFHATTPPYAEDGPNEWQNSALEEVESFVLSLIKSDGIEDFNVNTSIFLLLDGKGIEDRTCIVGEQKYDDEAEHRIDFFDKARVPWEEVHSMWVNLDIANMNFDDFCDYEQGCDENNWWQWNDSEAGAAAGLDDDNRAMRDEAIRKLEEEGKA